MAGADPRMRRVKKLGRVLSLAGTLMLYACASATTPAAAPPLVLVTLDPNATATPTPFQPAPAADTAVLNIILTEMASATQTPEVADTAT
jgi:hypothetical protein